MSRLLKKLEQYSDNLTIGEFKEKLKQERIQFKLEEEADVDRVRGKVEGKYFKFMDETYYGPCLHVIYVADITNHHRDTEWDLYYNLDGTMIEFSEERIYNREFTNRDSYSEKRFDEMTPITEEEYRSYYDKYIELHETLFNLVKL